MSVLDMLCACDNVHNMSKMIQIRNVPDELHRKLKAKAAERGQTLSDYLLEIAEHESETVSWEEMIRRLRRRRRVEIDDLPTADVIRELREENG
ncbi:MAG TPA: hypothetical protein VFI37_16275 [Gaiellaceae bacterium]|nr:hypothetical protein [Gaiellaceae bacterium]